MAMKQAHLRVAAIEAVVDRTRHQGCTTCHQWCGLVIMDDDDRYSQPEWCPDCGRHVPYTHVVHIVGVPVDAL
jgi:heterodisulfide reductase subunit A-like polyferredoxin